LLDSGSSLPSFITVTGTNTEVETDDVNNAGTYLVDLKCTLDNTPNTFLTTRITIVLTDPCHNSVTTVPTINPMTTSVKVASGAVTQTFSDFTDSVSESKSKASGYFCGTRTYTLSSCSPTNTFLTLSGK